MIKSTVILIIIKIIHLKDASLSCEYIYTREMTLFLREDMFGKLLRYRDTKCRKRHSSSSVVWQTQHLFLIKMWRRGRERITEIEKVRNKLGRDVSLPHDDGASSSGTCWTAKKNRFSPDRRLRSLFTAVTLTINFGALLCRRKRLSF